MVLCLPFAIYLSSIGAFGAFIHEYFVNTFATTQHGEHNIASQLILALGYITGSVKVLIPILAGIIGSVLAFRHFSSYKWLPAATISLIFIITAVTILWVYYLQIIGFAGICLFAWMVMTISNMANGKYHSILIKAWPVPLILCFLPSLRQGILGSELIGMNKHTPSDRELADMAITKWCNNHGVSHPKILYPIGLDFGLGLKSEAIPAAKHWFKQHQATKEMTQAREEAVRECVADILVINYYDSNPYPEIQGYIKLYSSSVDYNVAFTQFDVMVKEM